MSIHGDHEQIPVGGAVWNDSLHFLAEQCLQDSERWFPNTKDDLGFMALALGGEVGEVQNIIKKIERGTHSIDGEREHLVEELIDVLVYFFNLMGHPELRTVDFMKLWYKKREHNEKRFGDHRSESQRYIEQLPAQVLAEAGKGPEVTQTWQTPGEFAS